jgi:gliding motility-associated-like protein
MSRRFLLIASSILTFLCGSSRLHAQIDLDLFKLPDTVCNGHEIVPFNIIQTAQSYFWTFCPPNYNDAPEGLNSGGPVQSADTIKGIVIGQDEGVNYSFHINKTGGVYRSKYAEGLEGTPSMITYFGNLNRPSGIALANDGLWHLFVVSGSDSANSRLTRYDFNENGLKSSITTVDVGNLGGGLYGPKTLYILKSGNEWYGFSFNKDNELLRLDFGNNLSNTPTLVNLGNIDGKFHDVTAITGIKELDNWHLFVTNRSTNSINRISFGTNIASVPFVIELGSFGGRVSAPVGINITKDCDAYYGFVANYGNSSLVTLKWDNQSIANAPVATNRGNIGGFDQIQAMSNIARFDGAVYMFVPNLDFSFSKVIYRSCDNATPSYSNLRLPTYFKIDEPGTYTVFLTINEGMPDMQTDCEQIVVYDHPPITTSNDTLICLGDSIRLSILAFGADSFKWYPGYNIDTTTGQFVDVRPRISTTYNVAAYFDYNCIVKTPITVNVSQIGVDAGPDRIIRDGSTTILGGPGTTLGTQYSYEWTPDIGIKTGRFEPVAEVRPPYSMTYYLEVKNSDGCQLIDTVFVNVPCDDVNIPNAFMPNSVEGAGTYGILNQQFVNINTFKIFDRWGREMFSTTDPNGKWDGRFEGKEVPGGVYVWEVDANCLNVLNQSQERYRKSGTLTLIR